MRSHTDSGRRPPDRPAIITGALAWGAATFLFRYLTVEFTNDHFVHLSRGWQIVQGEVPIRDFFDPGLFLHYYASAGALLLSGHNLLGEALLTSLFMGAGAGLTFAAAARLSGSRRAASAVTLLVVMSMPRLYNYPKVFFYPLALVGAWFYADRPSRVRLVFLAAITVVAFLFRHDHGVYIAVSLAVLIAVRHSDNRRVALSRLVQYGGAGLLLVLPFLIFVQVTAGLPRYVRGLSPQAGGILNVRVLGVPFTFDATKPLTVVEPAVYPRIAVRWAPEVDESARRRLEAAHALADSQFVDGTWTYAITDQSRAAIGALVEDPAVEDTNGIDRGGRRLDSSDPLYRRLQRSVPLFRTRFLPGVLNETNAHAWLYYVTFSVPLAALLLLVALHWHGRIGRSEMAVAAMAAVLGVVIVQRLVRGSPDSRLPDVAAPVAVVGTWVWIHASQWAFRGRWVWGGLLSCFLLITFWSVWTYALVGRAIERSGVLEGPAGVWSRTRAVTEGSLERPIDGWRPEHMDLRGLTRYVFECTQPDHRVLVTWFEPRVFFYAERRFAGGQVYLHQNWHASREDQQLAVARLERQRVPVVLEETDSGNEQRFPLVFEYIRRYYVEAPMTPDLRSYRVLVDRRLTPTGTYEPLGLPCFR